MAASTNKDDQKRIDSLNEKNKRLQKKIDALTYQVAMQSKILNTGNLSTLQVLLDQLMAYINAHLKKIPTELLYTEYNANDTIALSRFRDFLLSVCTQLSSFFILTDKLVFVDIRRIKDKHSEIGNVLNRLNGMPHDIVVNILDEQDRLYEHILQVIEEYEEHEDKDEP